MPGIQATHKPDFAGWASSFLIEQLSPISRTDTFVIQSNEGRMNDREARLCISSAFQPAILVAGLRDADAIDLVFNGPREFDIWFAETTSKVRCFVRTADISGEALLLPTSQPFFVGFSDQDCQSLVVQWTGLPRHNNMHFLAAEYSFAFGGRNWTMMGSVSSPTNDDLVHILEVGRSLNSTYTVQLTPERGGISSDHANLLIHRLSSALGFASGQYSPPVFAAGTKGTAAVWLRFGADVREHRSGHRWADNITRADFQEYIEKYMAAASEEPRANSLGSIVFLYTQCVSCLPSIAPAILLGQSGLDELARWTLLDEEKLRVRFVRDLKAFDLFDLLFSVLHLSKGEVEKACWPPSSQPSFVDTLNNLTEVRNAIAHRGSDKDRASKSAAWHAVCRLLEIGVLASIGYRGGYGLPSESTLVDFGSLYRT